MKTSVAKRRGMPELRTGSPQFVIDETISEELKDVRTRLDELDADSECWCPDSGGKPIRCAHEQLLACGHSEDDAAQDAVESPCRCACHTEGGWA